MLEKYLGRILTSKFDHVVEDFDQEGVNVSAWKGEVSLKDLILKRTAFDVLCGDNVPVEIVYGKIGSLELQIPWSSLGSKSASIVLSDVCLLVTPREETTTSSSDDEGVHKKKRSKEERVQALLNPRILQHTIGPGNKKNRLSRLLSWLSSSLVANLSVTVKNIHIRYEDPGSSLGFVWRNNELSSASSFAIGLTLSQFTVQETKIADEHDGKEKLMTKYCKISRRLAAAYQLAIYWDNDCPLIAVNAKQRNDPTAAREHAAAAFLALEDGHLDEEQRKDSVQQYRYMHSYLLQPISPSIKFNLVTGTGSSGATTTFPPSTVTLSLPPCHIIVSRTVLENVAYLRKSFAFWKQSRMRAELKETLNYLNRIRPDTPPLSDTRAWWRYAIQATILLGRPHGRRRRRRGWSAVCCAILERQKYKTLYQQLADDEKGADVNIRAMEAEMEDTEIAACRLAAYEAMLELTLPDPKKESSNNAEADAAAEEIARGELSLAVRKSMMYDAIRILRQGQTANPVDEASIDIPLADEESSPLLWKTNLYCSEMSLQVNGRSSNNSVRPIARLSFACVQRQFLRRDGSWELDATVAAVKLIDMGVKGSVYPTLVGPKSTNEGIDTEDDFVVVSGQRFRRCVQVQMRRTFTRLEDGIGSTTHSIFRLRPLEMVYSTKPVTRLSTVFSSIRTPELAEDYERISSVLSQWQERQGKRLLQALAHRRKKISVDVDISAPVVLFPEDMYKGTGSVLVVDLGRVQFGNIDQDTTFDDVWNLKLSEMQVQSSRFLSYRDSKQRSTSQQIIEPFSLQCKISTTIASRSKDGGAATTSVMIEASLPRLVFNLKSSAVRLVSRLKEQWRGTGPPAQIKTTNLSQSSAAVGTAVTHSSKKKTAVKQNGKLAQSINFVFSAPIIAIKLDNDVDGRQLENLPTKSTPIVNLALRGIGGKYVQHVDADGSSSSFFEAKMRSLEAVDLFQQAGDDFALLLSSVSPSDLPDVELHTLVDQPEEVVHPDINTDLVSVQYQRRTSSPANGGTSLQSAASSLAIKFHELFVEWNPETLAAIQVAVRVPIKNETTPVAKKTASERTPSRRGILADSDDEFFDACEDDLESFCSASEHEGSSHMISEICSSRSSLHSDADKLEIPTHAAMSPRSPAWVATDPNFAWKAASLHPVLAQEVSSIQYFTPYHTTNEENIKDNEIHQEPFEITFELSTLRVAFNKESRHRRVIVAEMDNTSVRHVTREEGGSRTIAKIGNLVFLDPAVSTNSTLYSQVLGLKTDELSTSKSEPSLLELEFIANPTQRNFESFPASVLFADPDVDEVDETCEAVSINTATGDIRGCNCFVDLKFSPMRFVYLQQLWFEIIDYFFEGIVGSEVWGNERPVQEPFDHVGAYVNSIFSEEKYARRRSDLPGSDAAGITFTLFRVSLASPDVILPVEYRSPQFLRLTCQSLEVSNFYSNHVHQLATEDVESRDRVQWYNTCAMRFSGLALKSWCGTELTRLDTNNTRRPDVNFKMTWPTGPTKALVAAKWRVGCDLDEIELFLRSEDYALIQHILAYNIGEPSRHLEEWARFQEMPIKVLEAYKERIMVHYGYDKKDSAPSTYTVDVTCPLLAFNLLSGKYDVEVIAEAKCLNLAWTMQRLPDLVARQKLISNIFLTRPPRRSDDQQRTLPLLLPTKRGTALDGRPDIIYTSTTSPSGDNVKTLDVIDVGINLTYPAWMEAMAFFSNMGLPSIMTRDNIKNSIQVGDRWYLIQSSNDNSEGRKGLDVAAVAATREATTASFQFRLLLESPRIVIDSESDGSSVILHLDHLDFLHVNDSTSDSINRTFFVHNLEVYTVSSSSAHRDAYSIENSLISPWSFVGRFKRCNNAGQTSCEAHSLHISAQLLKARAAYSDMTIALDVAFRLMNDIRKGSSGQSPEASSARASSPENQQATEAAAGEKIDEHSAPECSQKAVTVSISFDGLEILTVDDSMRHFANAQELISFSLGPCELLREQVSDASSVTLGCSYDLSTLSVPATVNVVRVATLDLYDRLQKKGSRFFPVATIRTPEPSASSFKRSRVGLLEWHVYATVEDKWGFSSSPRVDQLFESESSGSASSRLGNWAIEYGSLVLQDVAMKHNVQIQSFNTQWNPSTVIALQRFLGRLLKELRLKSSAAEILLASPSASEQQPTSSKPKGVPVEATFSIATFSVCLNKEHQNRRLLKVILNGIKVAINIGANGNSSYIGRVEDVQAWDEDNHLSAGILEGNRSVVKVHFSDVEQQEDFAFFQFRYSTFSDGNAESSDGVPSWVLQQPTSSGGPQKIDDFLSIAVASVQLTYVRGRTEELIDYLSNGLPGKGMGVTSKAAKGFINKRIQTQSFLELSIAAPQLRIPEDEKSGNGVLLRLGDVRLKTWFELEEGKEGFARTDWCRALSVSILGLGWNTYYDQRLQRSDDLPIDLHFDLRKPMNKDKAVRVKGRLSHVVMRLKYLDYCLLRAVLTNNVGKKTDLSKWDNVEKAYWMEAAKEKYSSESHYNETQSAEQEVEYSSSARFIRYGTKLQLVSGGGSGSKIEASPNTQSLVGNTGHESDKVIDFGFKMDGIRLTLHRDDDVDTEAASENPFASEFHYDLVLLRLELVELAFSISREGDQSLHLSLSRIALFDKGDRGRLAREQYFINLASLESGEIDPISNMQAPRNPCAFSVIAEGYTSVENEGTGSSSLDRDQHEPQLVLTVDTCPASAVESMGSTIPNDIEGERVTIARMVINYLSVNAMIRPLREIVSFLTCAWSPDKVEPSPETKKAGINMEGGENGVVKVSKASSGFQLKLVAHYPRIFFLADESDPRSRALVLRG
jgi:hypothetical protein